MKNILFFATYPIGDKIIDGMAQRIHSIDEEFDRWHRTYIEIGLKTFIKKEHEVLDDGRIDIYRVNLFLHVIFLYHIIKKHSHIYIHSLHNYFKLYFFSLRHHNVTLDIHGTVPEEMAFAGSRFFSSLLSFSEKKLFQTASNFICVSEEMKDYYIEKYPFCSTKNFIIKPIFSQNSFSEVQPEKQLALKNELGIQEDDVVFIYSGNTQRWQNVELTIQSMIKYSVPNHFHILLTGDIKGVKKMMEAMSPEKTFRYIIRSVAPTELGIFYSIAHYGYILRDEHVLNREAAPTKLIEYLYYGIIPIVKYERIGDSFRLGYEHVNYQDDLSLLTQRKSDKNKEIALVLSSRNSDKKISNYLQTDL